MSEASQKTQSINRQVAEVLDVSTESEYANASRGLVSSAESLQIEKNGKIVWSQKAHRFLEAEECPSTVNPSLWQNGRNNHLSGLFQVTEKIYQVRGFDMSNLTMVLTPADTWIILDTLMSAECTQAAVKLADEYFVEHNLPKLTGNLAAIIISHSHVDHFGGIRGLFADNEYDAKVPIYAPQGFTEHAVMENLYSGQAMIRRASYQYGSFIAPGPEGSIAIGIGQGQSLGTVGFALPTKEITGNDENGLDIDGLVLQFQLTPGTEAAAEMNTYFPQYKALWMAENCTGTMHNLYTLRGAEIRDGNAWAKYITDAITLFGHQAEVVFQSHNWPHWKSAQKPTEVVDFMENTALVYKFLNDQTLFYLNQGYQAEEIAECIALPEELQHNWYTRPYYGTIEHNSKAVYQKFMGWYNANPAHLNRLSLVKRAPKLVDYMGGSKAVYAKAVKDFEAGNYQFVAEIMTEVIFAEPDNQEARNLCADAFDQLAYQAESGTWRNAYLAGAYELRNGKYTESEGYATASTDLITSLTAEMILDFLGILLDTQSSEQLNQSFNLVFTDDIDLNNMDKGPVRREFVIKARCGILLYFRDAQQEGLETLTLTRLQLLALLQQEDEAAVPGMLMQLTQGNEKLAMMVADVLQHLVDISVNQYFNIIEP